MSFSNGPTVVTNGLVLSLDAGDRNSYVSGSTTWFDLAGTNNGTLTNGPTFNTDNGGVITFDGTDDFGIVQSGSSGIQFPGNMSMDVFFKLTSYNDTWNNIVTKWDGVVGDVSKNDWHFSIKQFSSGIYRQNLYTNNNFDLFGSTNVLLNQWYFCCFTLVNNSLLSMYINGNLDITHANVSRGNANASLRISDPRSGFGLKNGSVGGVKIYNRALSASEVLQNYNALKGRFGL